MMYAGDQAGLNVSLGPGLSSKNLLLYMILVGIAVNAAVARNRYFDLPAVSVWFVLLIVYALTSWIAASFIFPTADYETRSAFIALKSSLVDQYITFVIFFFGIIYLKDAMWLLAGRTVDDGCWQYCHSN